MLHSSNVEDECNLRCRAALDHIRDRKMSHQRKLTDAHEHSYSDSSELMDW